LLSRIPNRGYSQGFMKGNITVDDYQQDESRSSSESIFVGNVIEAEDDVRTVLEVRNKISAGDILEILMPDGSFGTITMPDNLLTTKDEVVSVVNNSQFLVLEKELPPYSVLRRL